MYKTNINQQIRDYLTDTLTITREHASDDDYKKRVLSVISEIGEDNQDTYYAFLGTIFSDYYKMLYNKKNKKSISVEEEGSLIFFDSLKDIHTLSQELKLLPELTIDMVNETIEFNGLSFFEKRKVFITNKPKNTFLQQINPNHFLDQLYYCQSYDPDKFISLYNKIIKKGSNNDNNEIIKKMAIETLSSIYEELKLCDHVSTKKLGYAMLRDYYVFKKYEESLNKPSEIDKKIIRELEKRSADDIAFLSDKYDVTCMTKQIIGGFIKYNTEKTEEYQIQARDYLKSSIPNSMKTKLRYNKRRKTV